MTTIKDVARLAGVGVGTVSRVISGHGSVSPQAAHRVHAAIEALHFRPSSIGRALSSRSLGAIGVFVEVLRGELYRSVVEAADSEIRAVGRHMILVGGHDAPDRGNASKDIVDSLIETTCDGMLIVSHTLSDDDVLGIHDHFAHIAVLHRRIPGLEHACFSIDHYAAGQTAARTLIGHGHRRIGAIAGPSSAPDNNERMRGFVDELNASGMTDLQVDVVQSDFSPPGGFEATRALLEKAPQLSAIFCANDPMAMGALSYLRERAIRVPDQVSVLGYDDIGSSAFTTPALSSIHVPTESIAANAARWLIGQCYGIEQSVQREFSVAVAMRESVASVV
jgi:LacI family transcriptional regulator